MSTDVVAATIPAQRTSAESTSWPIVQRAQAGDTAALAELYEQYHGAVLRFILFRSGGNRPLAEDLMQDTFVRAFRSIGNFRWQGREYGAVLMTIARNLMADHFKSGRYRLEITTGEILGDDRVDPDRTDTAVESDGLAAKVRAAVANLVGDQRTAVQLRYFDGLTVAETAALMGKEEGAVKALCYRAMRTLARTGDLEAWR